MSEPAKATGASETSGEGWQGRGRAAKSLKWFITAAPLMVAAATSLGLSMVLPRPSSLPWTIVRVVVIAALSMTVITVVERAGRRLLPLTTLLRLSLVFPDDTPSRFKMALKAGSGKRMERALLEARTNGLSPDRARAAEQLVLLSTAIGTHDRRTRGHSERVRLYAELLGEELHLSDDERQKLQWAALIHDMGKVTVPPEILNKKGKPSAAEWAVLQSHPARGEELVAPVASWLGEWVHAMGGHHERWDGTGYPRGLAGHDIPRAAAIVAVADSFEVMTAVRSYKSAMPLSAARAELTRCSGTHFSPEIVRAFLSVSLPKLRRAGGAFASLAHVPFIGNALTAGAKAPEAWGYGIANIANAGSSAVAAAAVTGLLIAAPATAGTEQTAASVAAAAFTPESAVTTLPIPGRAEGTPLPETANAVIDDHAPTSTRAPDDGRRTDNQAPSTAVGGDSTGREPGPTNGTPTTTAPTTTITVTTGPATIPTVTTPPVTAVSSGPTTIQALIVLLQPYPDAYGDRGSNLLSKLQDLQSARVQYGDADSHVVTRANDLIDDVNKWLGEGRLDPTIGADAKQLLTALAN